MYSCKTCRQTLSNHSSDAPIYLGPEDLVPPQPAVPPQPRQKKRRFNWWGFNGMWTSFFALLTAGFLSPVTLLLSLKGLRRPGKKMAAVGTINSLVGITMLLAIAYSSQQHHHERQQRRQQARVERANVGFVQETRGLLADAKNDLMEYRAQHQGQLPQDVEGSVLVVEYVDPWGNSLRFEPESDFAILRSAGPDKQFLSGDDVTKKVPGKVNVVERQIQVAKGR